MTDLGPDNIEIIPPIMAAKPGRRRRYSLEEKRRVLDEAEEPGNSVSSVARRYGIAPSLVFRWRSQRDAGALTGLDAGEAVVPLSEAKRLRKRVQELERLLGRKTMEAEILKEAIEIAREKKLLSRGNWPDEENDQ